MSFTIRNLIAWLALAAMGAATVWALTFRGDPPADFTFVNASEPKSIDPAIATGQLESRIIEAIFEGLTSWDPKTLEALPGVAERWDVSPDKRVYTFHLHKDAKWSDGSPFVASDFAWSHQRDLDPQTGSQYCYQLFYVKNAEKYNSGRVVAGDKVEVEMNRQPPGARPFARGELFKGKLIKVTPPFPTTPADPDEKPVERTYVVEINGRQRTFKPDSEPDGCKQVLLDFDEVGLKALDDQTYEMTLINPTAYFLGLTGMFPLFPENPRCVETWGSPAWMEPEHIVTNGPFRLESRKIRERMRMVKSDTYWDRDKVKLNTMDCLIVQSDTTALNLYLTGKVDWIQNVPPTIVQDILKKYPDDFQLKPAFILRFYRLNLTKTNGDSDDKPLADPLVRKAIALAINKKEIVEGVTRAGEPPARSLVPPVIKEYMHYEPAFCGKYDPEEARRLLAKAGHPGGKGIPKLTILYSTDEMHEMIAELVQRQLKTNLGIDIEPQNQEWNAFLSAQQKLNYMIADSGWVGDYVDPNTFLGMFVSGGDDNLTGWSNAKYDELIKSAAREPDVEKRLGMLHGAEAILMDELPIVPLYFVQPRNMVRPYVHGFYNNVLDDHPPKWISVDEAARRKGSEAEGSR